MNRLSKLIGFIFFLILFSLFLFYPALMEPEPFHESSFVGRWESSRLDTSIYMHPNGEWEVLGNDGSVLQYGIWQYKNNMILWSNKVGSKIEHVASPVLAVSQQEFRVMDSESTTVTFRRLD